jgi:hypothetical protein
MPDDRSALLIMDFQHGVVGLGDDAVLDAAANFCGRGASTRRLVRSPVPQ